MTLFKVNKTLQYISIVLVAFMMTACSTTSHLEDGEELYTGLKPIEYKDYTECDHFVTTQAELEAALATAPNGALFGSSYYRTPFPYALWIYNALHDSNGVITKWFVKTFGKAPVLMSNVNPELRVSVAENVLQNYGYFHGNVNYQVIEGRPKTTKTDTVPRPRTAKIAYTVDMGPLFTIDTLQYTNFPKETQHIIDSSARLIKSGDPFNISMLDAERSRIYDNFRNHGYYYFNKSYTTYRADTLRTPGKVQLQMHLSDSLPQQSLMKWVIGRTSVTIKRYDTDVLTDTVNRRFLTIHFSGKRPPLRPSVILRDVKLRPGMLFSEDAYEESLTSLISQSIYSSANIAFTPRLNDDGTLRTVADTVKATAEGETRAGAGVLDMTVNCVLDKPYDFTLQANYLAKSSGRMGPGIGLGFAKRNAFRGGELLSLNLAASYEFQTGGIGGTTSNNYEISGDLSLSFPRLWIPHFIYNNPHRRWYATPTTIVSVSRETINRGSFFRRHIMSAELTYTFQPTGQSRHEVSPLIVEYDRLASLSDEYALKAIESPVLLTSLDDYFIPKIRYVYTYTSPSVHKNSSYLQLAFTEASNLLSLGYMAIGKGWNTKDKEAFKIPYSQFFKFEAEWRKTWMLDEYSSFVAHAQFGAIKTYGNTYGTPPYSEMFYIGGANSVRAFSTRSIGPGSSINYDSWYNYVTNVGNMKFVANLEYRPRLFGSLYGAVFLDAGNIWYMEPDAEETFDEESIEYYIYGDTHGCSFRLKNFLKDLAVGAGVGVRYDLGFFVLRLDWGFVIHNPRRDAGSGYFNFPGFKNGQCLNFAIGYPF